MDDTQTDDGTSRRTFLRRGLSSLVGLGLGAAAFSFTGCSRNSGAPGRSVDGPAHRGYEDARSQVSQEGPLRTFTRAAEPIEIEVGPRQIWHTWGYDGRYPGPEIRLKEGERLRVRVQNDLPDAGTTVHWHGVPVPNAMDGVPGLTQEPIASGRSMVYEFDAAPSGTYMYHSHRNLQLDRGLVGPLIIEERTPHVDYDREHLVVLDDFLPGPPQPLEELAARDGEQREGAGMMDGMRDRMSRMMDGGMMRRGTGGDMMEGGMGGSMMRGMVPPYEGLMINGRLPETPASFDVRQGERVRFRLINVSSATAYHLALSGHRMRVTHTEGRPVEPVEVDSLVIGMGERYDVIVATDNPGSHALVARPIARDSAPARAIVRYRGTRSRHAPERQIPDGLAGGRRLRYSDLQSVETPSGPRGRPDRTFDLELSGGMMRSRGAWMIDGQRYPHADPLRVREGEHVRVNMTNRSMMLHPMHLHGHFFRIGNALKDTVLVEPHMGQASFDFVANNPGNWFFHCHNLYHLHAGMARVITYDA